LKRLVALLLAIAGAAIAYRFLPRHSRDRLGAAAHQSMKRCFARMIARLPDDAPPKLVVSILPKLQAQNDQIIAMLQEQQQIHRRQRKPRQRPS
jgi:hypothetical protein